MNILERSYYFGKVIKEHYLAKSLIEQYVEVQSRLNMEWSLLDEAAKKASSYNHGYNKIPVGIEVLKHNRDNPQQYIRDSIEEILSLQEALELSSNMLEFKKLIDELLYSVSSPCLLKVHPFFKSQDIEREYRKYYVDFIRLGLVQTLLNYKLSPNLETHLKKIDRLRQEISYPFFWDESVINEIKNMASNLEEKKVLTITNILISLISIIEQVIYENHFDRLIILENQQLNSFQKNKSSITGLMEFKIEINDISLNPGWILFLLDNDKVETLLLTKKITNFSQGGVLQTLQGYVYPQNDKVFIDNYIRSIR